MRILIIEDEAPAARRLAKLVGELRPGAQLLGPCDTVAAAQEFLTDPNSNQQRPDLLLCDIELGDGLSFRLWEEIEVTVPVIFTTAYDHYAARAFRLNSVDYLLKPIARDQLSEAFARFEQRGQANGQGGPAAAQLSPEVVAQLLSLAQSDQPSYRQRVLTTHRQSLLPLAVSEIAYFISEDRLSFAITRSGKRYAINESLGRLTEELDPAAWFRVNRALLLHIDAVERAEPYLNHRLKLRLSPKGEGVVARERVRDFRGWLGGG